MQAVQPHWKTTTLSGEKGSKKHVFNSDYINILKERPRVCVSG